MLHQGEKIQALACLIRSPYAASKASPYIC